MNTRTQPTPGQQLPVFNSAGQNGTSSLVPTANQGFPSHPSNVAAPSAPSSSPHSQTMAPMSMSGSSQLPAAQIPTPQYPQPPIPMGLQTHQTNSSTTSLPALKPVFGLSLEDLLKRDGSAIPLVVYQCIQAVDLYGLEVEGIYRLSGSSSHVSKLKAIFDNGKLPILRICK